MRFAALVRAQADELNGNFKRVLHRMTPRRPTSTYPSFEQIDRLSVIFPFV